MTIQKTRDNMLCFIAALIMLCVSGMPLVAESLKLDDFETANWGDNGKLNSEYKKQGEYSLRWDATCSGGLATTALPKDWSAYAALSFWCYSEKVTFQKIYIVIGSAGPNGWGDYFLGTFLVDWQGWQKVVIPFSECKPERQPTGWQNITSVGFNSRFKATVPAPGTVLYFDDMQLLSSSDAAKAAMEVRDRVLRPLVEETAKVIAVPEVVIIPTPKKMVISKETVSLAESGEPLFSVLVSRNPSEVEMTAARELIDSIAAYSETTRKADIVREGSALPSAPVVIVLGVDIELFAKYSIAPPGHSEGYGVKMLSDQGKKLIFLAGKDKQGAYWAVQSLLQLLGKRDRNVIIPKIEITDWPTYAYRDLITSSPEGNSMAARYKINILNNWGMTQWSDPDEKYKSILLEQIKFALARGMNIAQGLGPYSSSKKQFIRCSKEEDIEKLYATYKIGLENGNRSIQIAFDDAAELLSSMQPEDQVFFAKDPRKAHAYLVAQIAKRVRRDYPGTLIAVTPKLPDYYGYGSPSVKQYYDDSGVDKDVVVMWTGWQSDITFSFSDDILKRYTAELDGRRFIYFDNTPGQEYGAADSPLTGLLMFSQYAEKYNNLHAYAYGILGMCRFKNWRLPELNNIQCMTMAEYMWNAESYDARTALHTVLAHVAGKDAVSHLLKFKSAYIRIITSFPELYVDLQKLPETQQKKYRINKNEYAQLKPVCDELGALLDSIKGTCRHEPLTNELSMLYKRAADNLESLSRQ